MTVARVLAAALACAALSPAVTVVRQPYIQNVRDNRATVLWATRERGVGRIEFGTDLNYGSLVAAPAPREFTPAQTALREGYFQYQVEITGLTGGTEYFYRVLVDGEAITPAAEAGECRFRTAAPGPFTFLVLGDSGDGGPGQRAIAAMMARERAALVLHTGDNAYPDGTFEQFHRQHFDVYAGMMRRVPFFPSPGNHDYRTGNAAPYLSLHALPGAGDVHPDDFGRYYSFSWGDAHFTAVDSNLLISNSRERMLAWLERDLQRTTRFWKVVYFHHAPYAGGDHFREFLPALVRQTIVPILERNGVQLVFNGHEHNYQRSHPLRDGVPVISGEGTVYITTGGGGAGLYRVEQQPFLAYARVVYHYMRVEVDGPRLTVRAISTDGQSVEEQPLVLAPRPGVLAEGVVNAATYSPNLAPGSLVTIFGRNLGVEAASADAYPWPRRISDTNVALDGTELPLLFVSQTQINTQLPYEGTGAKTLRVTTRNGTEEVGVSISEAAPAIFRVTAEGGSLPAITHNSTGRLVSPVSPAATGDFITVYLTGLGAVTATLTAGQATPPRAVPCRALVQVEIGGFTLTPTYAGLTPGFAGLYQVNVRLPEGLGSGTHALRVLAGDAASNPVNLPVGASAE